MVELRRYYCQISVDTSFNAGNLPKQNISRLNEKIEEAISEWAMEMQENALLEVKLYRQLGTPDEVRKSIQELQIYKENEKRNLSRTDRLMDECVYRHENGNCLKVGGFCTSVPLSHCQRYKDCYTEYRAYKQLGTLDEVQEAVEKQKLEDSGLLLKLPCKIGSKVYVDVNTLPTSKMGYDKDEFPDVLPATVVSYRYLQKTLFVKIAVTANWETESFDNETGYDVYYCEYRKDFSYRTSMFGKHLFLTREEAFRNLKEV